MVGIFAVGSPDEIVQTLTVDAVYKQLARPSLDCAIPSRDIASPQTLSSFSDPLPNVNSVVLGSFAIDDNGDYAFDEGLVNLKKRIYRRLIFKPGSFPHMPTYGVGVPTYAKQLNTAATRGKLASEAETQISKEPDVEKCVVQIVTDSDVPSLVRFRILVRTKLGQQAKFDVPFAAV
jgi:hypothetical protein